MIFQYFNRKKILLIKGSKIDATNLPNDLKNNIKNNFIIF